MRQGNERIEDGRKIEVTVCGRFGFNIHSKNETDFEI